MKNDNREIGAMKALHKYVTRFRALFCILCQKIRTLQIAQDNSGFALVTSLMLTMISLVIVMALMYIITQGIQFSGANKRYHSSLQASYGATEIVTKGFIQSVFAGYTSSSSITGQYPNLSGLVVSDCLGAKISMASSNWPSSCSTTSSPKDAPDVSFLLQSDTQNPFRVYAKVVDTYVAGQKGRNRGNTETAEISTLREAVNVTDPKANDFGVTIPTTFRIEVQGERQTNPQEKAQLSVLYAY